MKNSLTPLKHLSLIALLTLGLSTVNAQNIGINGSGATPNVSAILDIASADKGLLVPRVALTATTNNAPIGVSVAASLLVYNTATTGNVTPGYYYWDTKWVRLTDSNGADKDGIYDGSGFLSGATTVTGGTNKLGFTTTVVDGFAVDGTTFSVDALNNRIGIGTTTPNTSLTIKNENENVTLTNFTQSLVSSGINIETEYTQDAYTPGVFWSTLNNSPLLPKAGIFLSENGFGTTMHFGTSNLYATGITNSSFVLNPSGNVGIGTTTPVVKLEVVGDVTIGDLTSVDGRNLRIRNSATNIWNIDVIDAGNSRFRIFSEGGASGNPERFTILENGRVGIGTDVPNGQLELTFDQGRKPGTSTWTITSDERLKNINGAYTKGLSEILKLNTIRYHYKNVGKRKFEEAVINIESIGFSAQEVQKIFPEAVGVDDDGYLNLNIHAILIAHINATKEQQQLIEAQQEQIEQLIKRIEQLER